MIARLAHCDEWSASLKQAMFTLLARHFVGVSRDQFECDLANKNWAVLARDAAGALVGFSTLAMYQTTVRGQRVSVVCSGDTIVDRSRPASTALLSCWLQSVLRLHEPNASHPLYWLLIVSGFRTYRFLPVFWREFAPRHDSSTLSGDVDPDLMHILATERFGQRYDASTGIVRLERPQVLRADLGGIPAGRLDDPHVAFFAKRNPGHQCGDELVCLTHVHPSNLTAAGRRMARASRQSPLFAGA